MERSHISAQPATATKQKGPEHDGEAAKAPLQVGAGPCATTDVQAMMSAGGNLGMVQLSQDSAGVRHKGDKDDVKKESDGRQKDEQSHKGDSEDKKSQPPVVTSSVSSGKSAANKGSTSIVKRKTSVSKMSGPGPNALSIHTGYGVCDTEEVKPTITVTKEGANFKVTKVDFEGIYSIICTLGGAKEVTGPGGNTTKENYLKQSEDLDDLGEYAGTEWYMLAAVVAHEAVHETSLAPALVAVEPTMAAKFTALSVAESDSIKDEGAALAAIKALPAYAAAVASLRKIWDDKYVELITGDHNTKTPAAEHAVVDPMIDSIDKWADEQDPKLPKYERS